MSAEDVEISRQPVIQTRVPETLLERVDAVIEDGEFRTRSDLVREGIRRIVTEAECRDRLDEDLLEQLEAGQR